MSNIVQWYTAAEVINQTFLQHHKTVQGMLLFCVGCKGEGEGGEGASLFIRGKVLICVQTLTCKEPKLGLGCLTKADSNHNIWDIPFY